MSKKVTLKEISDQMQRDIGYPLARVIASDAIIEDIMRGTHPHIVADRVFTNCNVCGCVIRTDKEDRMGMCVNCAFGGNP